LKVCPNYVPAKIGYIEILARRAQTKEAIERSSEFLQELQSNTDFLFARGLALYYDGQPYILSTKFNNLVKTLKKHGEKGLDSTLITLNAEMPSRK
jgi:hypothetical protein